jgi:hypothetical protein
MAAYFGRPAEIAAGDAAAEAVEDARDDPQPVSASFAPPALTASWSLGDDDDDGDAMPSFTLPLRKTVAPTIAFDHHDTPENDDDIAGDESDDSYSSLLAIRNPFAPKDSGFVRIDEPEEETDVVQPAVVFPGNGQADSSAARAFDPPTDRSRAPAALPNPPATETDAALRTALATLQRMSGTA